MGGPKVKALHVDASPARSKFGPGGGLGVEVAYVDVQLAGDRRAARRGVHRDARRRGRRGACRGALGHRRRRGALGRRLPGLGGNLRGIFRGENALFDQDIDQRLAVLGEDGGSADRENAGERQPFG